MKIEDLIVRDECLGNLKRVGFTTVEEIVEFLDNNWGMIPIPRGSRWLLSPCFEEAINQLKLQGFRLKHEGQNWDGSPK